MIPAPRKPMPETIIASACGTWSATKDAAPNATSVLVRSPAMPWYHCRSNPTAAPISAASVILKNTVGFISPPLRRWRGGGRAAQNDLDAATADLYLATLSLCFVESRLPMPAYQYIYVMLRVN